MRTRLSKSSSDSMSLIGGHRTVLLHEVVEQLAITPNDICLDATLGGAGHAKEIANMLGTQGIFLGIDADHDAIVRAEEKLKDVVAKVILEQGNFRNVESYLGKHGIPHLTKAVFDLGWSGFQLLVGRGFSFLQDEPLLMTYSDAVGEDTLTAGVIVNTWGEESIADIVYGWGEERYSHQIARAIVEARKSKKIETSKELADIIKEAVPSFYRRGHIHPATKTFQALRITVNDEMGALKEGLTQTWKSLKSGGRLAVITFHSIEDRDVKRLFLEWSKDGTGERLTKSPIRPSREEQVANPRSRSAKLRVIRKL